MRPQRFNAADLQAIDANAAQLSLETERFRGMDVVALLQVIPRLTEALRAAQAQPPVDLELLAAQEHAQWAAWTRYMLSNLTPENIERWRRQCDTQYAELSEREKESDRDWARRALSVLGLT
jgi:hypothetical protein